MGQRIRIWLRRIGRVVIVLILTVTAASFVYNRMTVPPNEIEPGFGSYVRVGDASVHYQHWGTHGSPIVLVPGAFESSIVWQNVGPLLARNHRVYALDMSWYGYTRDISPITLTGQAELLDGFIGALHLPRPLLVGHSMGAAVTARLALDHRQAVSGVVFADGDARPIPIGNDAVRWVLHAFASATPYLTSVTRIMARWPSGAESMIRSVCGNPCPGLTPALAKQWVRPLGQRSAVDALHSWFGGDSYGLTTDEISSIAVPTEIIWGDGDQEGGTLQGAIANLGHPPVYIIKDAGHLSMLANPAMFASAVEAAARTR
ncbi:alpha/beta hydrolase [Nocardioides baekrokdamisoli]|uniref:Alpha/beta hydrolase n=1 Tax=Nocardioides baekrokdamisoli TaxID=1804624 RepID=A0A3G9IJT5_9ACTN|nr:alpha/beta hydrolase [Nocardioides baekrokdamisoli]BBH18432.1 alpha/beta hydrolase [Nocardioides baekrokdamisoli]